MTTHREFEAEFSKQLLPCPFCGSQARIVQWRDTLKPNATWAECTNERCRANCGVASYSKNIVTAACRAVKRWNRRASCSKKLKS